MATGERTVSQRGVEMAVGRLATDEAFRSTFRRSPAAALDRIIDAGGIELTASERAALLASDPDLWERVANAIDPRLQKLDLSSDRP